MAVKVTMDDHGTYLFPSHPSEIDRLDVQHYALCLAFGGNHLAPVAAPGRVLDTGCGTGQWAFDICRQFPGAMVVGVDRQPTKPAPPANFRLVRANLLRGLPLAGDQFDFVHQRLLVPAVPIAAWDALIAELVRVVRPGGWVELVEADWAIEPSGPATRRLVDLAVRLGMSLGLDSTASIYRSLDHCLRRAGLIQVGKRTVAIPLGEWAGRVGSLMATDFRAASTRLGVVYSTRFGVPEAECSELVRTAWQEWEALHSRCGFAVAYGRKPAPARS